MKSFARRIWSLASPLLMTCAFVQSASADIPIPNTPLIATTVAKPLTMLVAGRDHKLFYEAYNDASDIDGDGVLDIRFKPKITYYGLFDPNVCYSHNGASDNTGLFSPAAAANSSPGSYIGKCGTGNAGRWSGNFLNYLTTSRIDALRKVLYGGYREVDTALQTILRRAYIPQDAHSWGKEYKDETTDGYKIQDYTPFDPPSAANKRHFFGSLTSNRSTSCATLNNCSNLPPLLRIRRNVGNDKRIWEWSSKERPVLDSDLASGAFPTGTHAEENYTVRVEVCTGAYISGCKQYPNGNYKPVGLLHDYGESESMYFGLLTGSYDKHMSGGRMRKELSSFKNEINANDGTFTINSTIVSTFNKLRIRGYNQSSTTSEYWKSSPYADSAKAPTEGQLVDWGNPIGEMLYETIRYLDGKTTASTAFAGTTTVDTAVGLDTVTSWTDPYSPSSSVKAPWCARANMVAISDINTSFDSNQIPGSYFQSFSGDLSDFDATNLANTITNVEPNIVGAHFIGQSGALADTAPTAKSVTSLALVRGLSPEEPNRQGSYYSAAAAYYAKTHNNRSPVGGDPKKKQKQIADTYAIALASPLPQINAVLPNGSKITVVPFAKSVGGSGISGTKGNYQPTNQIVDYYVISIANSGTADKDLTVNGGRYYAKFGINFEDVEQGGDHDMDAISEYEITANVNDTLTVKVTPTYQAGGIQQNMGYVISGTTKDGVYLVVQDEATNPKYFLNVPPGRTPGYCDVATPPADCSPLPTIGASSTFTFYASTTPPATFLKDPLWYAAKWGGFIERSSPPNNFPDVNAEWDSDNDGTPDTYSLVQNPTKLKESLKRSFDTIIDRSASAGNITSNGQQITTDSKVFQTIFNSATWDGELYAYPISSGGVNPTPAWRASEHIPSSGDRTIFTWKDSTTKGVEFKTLTNLSSSEQAALSSQDVLDYLRGEKSKELQNSGSFRNRTRILGDIVHSSPYYVKDTDTVYVGSNDGMLHAFRVSDGVELFTYVPSMVYSNLKSLSDPFYSHKFFVDGDMSASTLTQTSPSNPSAGKNWLVATLGRGAKGLFGLDVTKPASFTASNVLWEYDGVTPTVDNDLGYMIGRPQIGRVKADSDSDGEYDTVAVVGNGYNSTNGGSVLYVFNAKTGAVIQKINTSATGNNGLATPFLWDADGDGFVDYVYAGDLLGNVWKFDIKNTSPALWGLASGVNPIFVAVDGSNNRQPITAQLTVAVDTVSDDPNINKTFVLFGTGSYIFSGDPSSMTQQSWYGIVDDGTAFTGRDQLKERTIEAVGTITKTDGTIVSVRAFSEKIANDMVGKKGWFIDLKDPTARGERIVTSSKIITTIEPTLFASSIIPDNDPCVPGGSGYLNAVNAFTGARLASNFFDVNGNGQFDDLLGGRSVGSVDLGVGMPGEAIPVGDQIVVGGSSGAIKSIKINLGTKKTGRLMWREIK